MKMHWDGRKCFLRFIRGTTQLDRHDAYPLCAGARTCFLDNGRTRLSLPAPPDLRPFPPASLRKSALRGDLPSGSLDRAHTLPGSLSKACPAPSPSLRIPIYYSRIFPFLQGGFANFQGRRQRLCLWTPQGALPLDPSRDAVPAPCKGVPPLTLSRDGVARTFMLCPRVYPAFRVCGRIPLQQAKSSHIEEKNPLRHKPQGNNSLAGSCRRLLRIHALPQLPNAREIAREQEQIRHYPRNRVREARGIVPQ